MSIIWNMEGELRLTKNLTRTICPIVIGIWVLNWGTTFDLELVAATGCAFMAFDGLMLWEDR